MTTSSSKKPTPRKRASASPAAKPASADKASIRKVPSPAEVPPKTMQAAPDAGPGPSGPEMKKQELVEKVVQLSGIKKRDAKPVVEAMLEVLGETLAEGRGLNLQPFGKLKLNRTKETPNARIIVAKLRQSKAAKKAALERNQTVAAAAE